MWKKKMSVPKMVVRMNKEHMTTIEAAERFILQLVTHRAKCSCRNFTLAWKQVLITVKLAMLAHNLWMTDIIILMTQTEKQTYK